MSLSAPSSLVSDVYQVPLNNSPQDFYGLSIFSYYAGKELTL